jgi:hypothetical protein
MMPLRLRRALWQDRWVRPRVFGSVSPTSNAGVKSRFPAQSGRRRPHASDARCRRTRARFPCVGSLPQCAEAVAQTRGQAAGSFLRVGSEIDHRIRHARGVRPEVITPSRSGSHLRDRAAALPNRLYATATATSSSGIPFARVSLGREWSARRASRAARELERGNSWMEFYFVPRPEPPPPAKTASNGASHDSGNDA